MHIYRPALFPIRDLVIINGVHSRGGRTFGLEWILVVQGGTL